MNRSPMFFQSDVYAAAETAAFELECHGLSPDEVQTLSERIHETIEQFFSARDALPPGAV